MEILLPGSITFYRHRHVILHQHNKFYRNWTITDRVMTLCRFSKIAAMWRPYRRKSDSFAFWFCDVLHLDRQRTISTPNFEQIFQFTAKILLLPVAENKRSQYLNSTSGFDFDLFTQVYRHRYVILHRPAKFYTK